MKKILYIGVLFVLGYCNGLFDYNTDKKSNYEFENQRDEELMLLKKDLMRFKNNKVTNEEIKEYIKNNNAGEEKYQDDVIIFYAPSQEKYNINYYEIKKAKTKPWWKFWEGDAKKEQNTQEIQQENIQEEATVENTEESAPTADVNNSEGQ